MDLSFQFVVSMCKGTVVLELTSACVLPVFAHFRFELHLVGRHKPVPVLFTLEVLLSLLLFSIRSIRPLLLYKGNILQVLTRVGRSILFLFFSDEIFVLANSFRILRLLRFRVLGVVVLELNMILRIIGLLGRVLVGVLVVVVALVGVLGVRLLREQNLTLDAHLITELQN